MKALVISLAALLIAANGAAQAELPVQVAPQVGFYLTKSFGAKQTVPVELGAKFHYGDVNADIYHRHSQRYRPALFDLRFNANGLTAFETAGVNVMQPRYMLGASDEGFFSSINWGLVGLALIGVGIYSAAEDDRDDREERIAEHKADTEDGSAMDDGEGAAGGDEGEEGGEAGGTTGTPLDVLLDPLAGMAG